LTAGVNVSVVQSYNAALRQALASVPQGEICHCPCDEGVAICRGGKCQAGFCGPSPSDTLPACAAAGGHCFYTAKTTCTQGPAHSCAYADEVCCTQ
jgi:hypothetical protein